MPSYEPYRAIAARTAIPGRCYGLDRDALETDRKTLERIKASAERPVDYLKRIEQHLARMDEPRTSREIARALKIKLTTCRSAIAELIRIGAVERAGSKREYYGRGVNTAAAYRDTGAREDI